jgi:acyl-CoA synthetase (AMP-forming)/AMP-acid ligase II
MPKFDVRTFLELSQQHRVTHALLVPIQYRRVLDDPDFGNYNLSSYRMKYSTSAAFPPDLKRQVLNRWPGGLIDYYGMTEGGGTCALLCHEFPHKLHTVGRPLPGHDIRIINARGNELARGEVGEIVGHSASMMAGYHNQPLKTSDAEWINSDGQRFIRTGDIGHFDEDGFLVLRDRRKDMIISGGFNIYPSDIEAQILQHEAVLEAAVVGTPSTRWGESPVAFVVLRQGAHIAASELKAWVNDRVGRTQRLEDLRIAETLPRSPIGKVLKRQLRDEYLVS